MCAPVWVVPITSSLMKPRHASFGGPHGWSPAARMPLRRAVGDDLERRVARGTAASSGSGRARAGTCARVRIMPASSTHLAGLVGRRARATAPGASSASPSSRARGRSGLMRVDAVAQLALRPRRAARGRSATQSTITGTIVSRNDSESAACRRSASGQPPSSCTRTRSGDRVRELLAGAALDAGRARRGRRSGPGASGCTRASPSSRAESQPAAASGYARSMSCVAAAICSASDAPGSSSQQPVERALQVPRVRVHLGDPRLRAFEHARSRGHRPRLEHEDLAALERPLDVLRARRAAARGRRRCGRARAAGPPPASASPPSSRGQLALLGAAVLDRDDRERLRGDLRACLTVPSRLST